MKKFLFESFRSLFPCLLIGISLLGCALPPGPIEGNTFIRPDDVLVSNLVNDGILAAKGGRYEDALNRLTQAQALAPQSEPIQANLVSALMHQGFYTEAHELASVLQQRRPENFSYTFALADSFYALDRYEEAVSLYREALRIAQETPENGRPIQKIAVRLSDVLFLMGEVEEGRCLSELSWQLDPKNKEEFQRHLKALLASGFYQAALDMIDRGGIGNLSAEVVHFQAISNYALGRIEIFEELEAKAKEAAGEDPLVLKEIEDVNRLIQGDATIAQDLTEDEKQYLPASLLGLVSYDTPQSDTASS